MANILRNRFTIPWTPFYRRYPYRNGISINSADARGLIDFDLGIFCNRIPKAANSSIIVNLAYCKYGREIPSKQAKKLFRTPSGLSKSEVGQLDQLFRFTFVRNPYTRVLSAFLDKVDRRAKRRNQETSFLEFLQYLEKEGLYSNAHWAPQTSLLLMPLENFDFIGKTENLTSDLGSVLSRIGHDSAAQELQSVLSNATGAGSKIAHYYNNQEREIVERLYRGDFERLGYSKALPESP
ncbi:sulfotransferase family protein [Halospina denitrificans]|uniref:Sulfotransferase family protein n=1 Tax=Halospina denitrificans TaxID=332522 RepID=A0A4R7K190_9GAMM|nr:sulfotransferase family protein [Halospina denitrificans]TDT44345.1 sulfotransferase family protein [Halospina denitrificans]